MSIFINIYTYIYIYMIGLYRLSDQALSQLLLTCQNSLKYCTFVPIYIYTPNATLSTFLTYCKHIHTYCLSLCLSHCFCFTSVDLSANARFSELSMQSLRFDRLISLVLYSKSILLTLHCNHLPIIDINIICYTF